MKGEALVSLLVNSKGDLVDFVVCKINVSDEKNENRMDYSDFRRPEIHKRHNISCYPKYVQPLYEVIEKRVMELKFVYSDYTGDLRKKNLLFMKFRIIIEE